MNLISNERLSINIGVSVNILLISYNINVFRDDLHSVAHHKSKIQSCEELHPQTVFYNRIPKTGSTTTVQYVVRYRRNLRLVVKSGKKIKRHLQYITSFSL